MTMTKTESTPVEIHGDVLTPEQLCVLAHLSFDTLAAYRRKGMGPREVRLGNAVRFLRADAMSWLEGLRTHTPTG